MGKSHFEDCNWTRDKRDDPIKDVGLELCSDCPPLGYPTDDARCLHCPRRANSTPLTVKGQ